MLFYQFLVSRNSEMAYNSDHATEACMMLRVDTDVETCTDDAVRYLAARGWKIASVRHAQLAEGLTEFSGDERLVRLYQQASRQGIACAVGLIENIIRPTVSSHAHHAA